MSTSVYRAVITMLAGLPMLLPPGLCTCTFARQASPAPNSTVVETPRCCCSGHAKKTASRNGVTKVAKVDHVTSGLPRQEHDRGCPAVFASTPNKIRVSTAPAFFDFEPQCVISDVQIVSAPRIHL